MPGRSNGRKSQLNWTVRSRATASAKEVCMSLSSRRVPIQSSQGPLGARDPGGDDGRRLWGEMWKEGCGLKIGRNGDVSIYLMYSRLQKG